MPVDSRDFGRLETEVEALREQVRELRSDVRSLLEMANKSKGGLWVGMSLSSLFGGVAVWIIEHILKR